MSNDAQNDSDDPSNSGSQDDSQNAPGDQSDPDRGPRAQKPETRESKTLESRTVYLRPGDKRELKRVLRARPYFSSLSRVLRDHLSRSLLPRIKAGRCRPGLVALEVVGRRTRPAPRKPVQVRLSDWAPLRRAAQRINGDLRRLEERVTWRGTLRPVPFCRLGSKEILRTAAREIAVATREGTPRYFSQELQWPTGQRRWAAFQQASRQEPVGQEPGGQEPASTAEGGNPEGEEPPNQGEPSNQLLSKPPGRKRGGKPVQLALTKEASQALKQRAEGWPWDGSSLARRALRMILAWAEESPSAVFRFIQEESSLYKKPREGRYDAHQINISLEDKRRLKQVRKALQKGVGEDLGRRFNQREILRAAARLVIEFEEEVRPPPPGENQSGKPQPPQLPSGGERSQGERSPGNQSDDDRSTDRPDLPPPIPC